MLKKLYAKNNDPAVVDSIVRILEDGGLLIYPTDTLYAVGCHALKERAVERICRLKGIDPRKNNLSIVCSDMSQASEYAKMSNTVFKLMKGHLPGPFTFVLPTSNRLPRVFRGRKEVGIRIPNHPVVQELCRALGAPLLSTTLPLSADDESDYVSVPELIDERFGRMVDLVIDGGVGGLTPSTVVDCTTDEPFVARQGAGWLTSSL